MRDISYTDIRRIDLTLLLIFAELMRHRKLTTVAARLGLQQSSISHALKRLRDIFGDELFRRHPGGVVPTARARELEPMLLGAIDLVRAALDPSPAFDPATADQMLRISGLDYDCALFAAPLIERLRDAAPGVDVSFRPLARRAALDALRAGELDLAIGFFPRLPAEFDRALLFEETYAVVARRGHPIIRGTVSMEQYVAAEHVVVSLDGGLSGIVDHALAEQRLTRRVRAALPYFFLALATVSRCDAICTIPRRLAFAHAATFGLQTLEPPLAIRPFRVAAAWHQLGARSRIRAWAVEQLAAIADVLGSATAPAGGRK